MTPKRILLSAGALLLALLVVLIVGLSKSNVRASSDAHVGSGDARIDSSPNVLADTFTDSDPARTRSLVNQRATQAARKLPPFAECTGVRLAVVSAGDRSPAPAADVRIFEQGFEEMTILDYGEAWIGPDFEAFMNANGRAFVTDENGEVDLPRPARPTFVTARLGDRFGWGGLEPGQTGLVELQVAPMHSIVARVRDSRGNPQSNVRVAFGRCEAGDSLWAAPTDARGEVRIPAIEVLLGELSFDKTASFALRLLIPEQTAVEQWLTLETLPAGPIDFVLPATGSVRVRIVDEAGLVLPVSGSVDLRAVPDPIPGHPHLEEETGHTRANLVNGVAVVPRVGLGLRFQLSADMPGTGDVDHEFAGPTTEGQEVVVDLSNASDHTLLLGRLVDESGRPLSNFACDWRRVLDDNHTIQASGRNRLVTDGEGRFMWTLRRSSRATGESTHRTGFLCELTDAPLRRQATVHFPLELATASTQLGDIVMSTAPALARGRVLDANGRPAADADVTLMIKTPDEISGADTFDSAVTAADGSFAIYGPCLALEFVLDVTGPTIQGHKLVPFECASGTRELEIRIDPAGGFEGTALVDPEAATDGLTVTFTPDGDGKMPTLAVGTRRAGNRVFFRFERQDPGAGKVRFHPYGDAEPAAVTVSGVVVEAGTVSRPPTLVDVDLRGKLPKLTNARGVEAVVEFTVVDVLGRSIPRGLIWATPAPEDEDRRGAIGSGKARLPVSWLAGCESLEFWAPGMRATSVSAPFASRRIVLEPELEIEFRLALPKPWTDAKIEAVGMIELRPMDPPQYSPMALARMHEFRFDAKGRAHGGLPAGGRFAIYIALRRYNVEGLQDVDYYGVELVNGEFTVRETDGLQVFELALNPDAVAQCNEALGLK